MVDKKQKLWDGSFRVFSLVRADGESFELPNPIEYSAKCVRLAFTVHSDDWKDTADKWNISIGKEVFEYYTGVGRRKGGKAVKPELSEVLYHLFCDASACETSFRDWCDDYGYDMDSRKALNMYLACQEINYKLRKAKVYRSTELSDFLFA